jgi:hypothetical protein
MWHLPAALVLPKLVMVTPSLAKHAHHDSTQNRGAASKQEGTVNKCAARIARGQQFLFC